MRNMEDARKRLYRGSPVLAVTGWLHVALLVVLLALLATDGTIILGINRWIKPVKLAASIAIFCLSMAWVLQYLSHRPRPVRAIGWGISFAMIFEMTCITMQAARGTTSHFNHSTAFDFTVFNLMGLMIAANTVLVAWTLMLFTRDAPPLPPAYLAGIRWGLLIFLLASAEGGVLVGHNAHTVGAPDGGPGLPFVNWSTEHGDLRVAHFAGLHALQLLPLLGYWMRRVEYVSAAAWGYLALFGWLLYEALRGHPLV